MLNVEEIAYRARYVGFLWGIVAVALFSLPFALVMLHLDKPWYAFMCEDVPPKWELGVVGAAGASFSLCRWFAVHRHKPKRNEDPRA